MRQPRSAVVLLWLLLPGGALAQTGPAVSREHLLQIRNAQIEAERGTTALNQGRYEEALAHFEKSIEVTDNLSDSVLPDVAYGAARAAVAIGDWEKARRYIRAALDDSEFTSTPQGLQAGRLAERIEAAVDERAAAAEQRYQQGRDALSRGDHALAFDLFEFAANQDHAASQFEVGVMYQNGRGVPRDYSRALEWYRRAAERGHANAENNIGWMYRDGLGVEQSDIQAVIWFTRAARKGDAAALTNLADAYMEGRGVQRNDVSAFELLRQSAEKGQRSGQNNLGWMYENGRGVAPDYSRAVEWYRKAAEQGEAAAQFHLGESYEHGRGVPRDIAQAREWYQRAVDTGATRAQDALDRIQREGAATPSADPFERYRGSGIEIVYPSNWEVRKAPDSGSLLTIAPVGGSDGEAMNIAAGPTSRAGMTLEAATDEVTGTLDDNLWIRVAPYTSRQLGGRAALSTSFRISGSPTEVRLVTTLVGDRQLYAFFAAAPTEIESYGPTYDRMLDSVRFRDLVDMQECVVAEDGTLETVTIQVDLANSERFLDGRLFSAVHDRNRPPYGAGADWVRAREDITLNGVTYRRFGLSRVIGASELRPAGWYRGIALFRETADTAGDNLYVADGPGCSFRLYRRTGA